MEWLTQKSCKGVAAVDKGTPWRNNLGNWVNKKHTIGGSSWVPNPWVGETLKPFSPYFLTALCIVYIVILAFLLNQDMRNGKIEFSFKMTQGTFAMLVLLSMSLVTLYGVNLHKKRS